MLRGKLTGSQMYVSVYISMALVMYGEIRTCDKAFLCAFKQDFVDCRWHDWNEHICNSKRFKLFRIFCNTHELRPFIAMNMDRHLKHLTARFRMGISDLSMHKFRYKSVQKADLLCPVCGDAQEDEVYFVLHCRSLGDIGEGFIIQNIMGTHACSNLFCYYLVLI